MITEEEKVIVEKILKEQKSKSLNINFNLNLKHWQWRDLNMMVNPSKYEIELFDAVRPWLLFDASTKEFYLKEDAPEDIIKKYALLNKYLKKNYFLIE